MSVHWRDPDGENGIIPTPVSTTVPTTDSAWSSTLYPSAYRSPAPVATKTASSATATGANVPA
jgi:hypothetical protein